MSLLCAFFLKGKYMNTSFLKFKRKLMAQRVARSIMFGGAAGMALGGAALFLSKRELVGFEPLISLIIGLGGALLVGLTVFLLGRRSDKSIAEELDTKFGLKARVQTMVEYQAEEGDMFSMQRQDADEQLSNIPLSAYKFKGIWIPILSLVLASAILVGGILTENIRGYIPPEKVEPFALSELQAAGLEELIRYVEGSALEEEYRAPMAEELRSLLAKLRVIDTKPEMVEAMTLSMAHLTEITYESSTATEMLNAIWDSGDVSLRYLAKVLEGGNKSTADWGDFAERLAEYIGILMGDNETAEGAVKGVAKLKWAIDSMSTRLDMVLDSSGLSEDDEMYQAVKNIFDHQLLGLRKVRAQLDHLDDDGARETLTQSFNLMSEDIFAAVNLNRTNAAVGEYAMTRLAGLFGVPLPGFERPEFVKKNLSVDGGVGSDQEDDKEGAHGGGLGEGITYGANDMVLNPLTGKYVKAGDLLNIYNALMFEKLEGDLYTEEQKQMIKKYFDLLFSGLDEEGK